MGKPLSCPAHILFEEFAARQLCRILSAVQVEPDIAAMLDYVGDQGDIAFKDFGDLSGHNLHSIQPVLHRPLLIKPTYFPATG